MYARKHMCLMHADQRPTGKTQHNDNTHNTQLQICVGRLPALRPLAGESQNMLSYVSFVVWLFYVNEYVFYCTHIFPKPWGLQKELV